MEILSWRTEGGGDAMVGGHRSSRLSFTRGHAEEQRVRPKRFTI